MIMAKYPRGREKKEYITEGKRREEKEGKDRKVDFPEDNIEYLGILPCRGRNGGLYPTVDISIWMRTCLEEPTTPVLGKREGTIPSWLEGRLLQNGPGKFYFGVDIYKHLFDGSALLQQFTISGGEATYLCRFVRSSAFLSNLSMSGITVPEFGTPASSKTDVTFLTRSRHKVMSDNTMITVYPFDGSVYTFYESPYINRIEPGNLATLGREDLSSRGIISHGAHPHWDRQGNMITMGLKLGVSGPKYIITQFRRGNKGSSLSNRGHCLGEVPCRRKLSPSYMHSFSITDQWVVLIEQPLVISIRLMVAAMAMGKSLASCMKWKGDKHTVIHLLNRITGACHPIQYLASPVFFLHTINAYEDSGHVVLDLCGYNSPAMLNCMYLQELSCSQTNTQYARLFRGRPRRYVLPLSTGERRKEDLDGDLVTLSYTTASAHRLSNTRMRVSPAELVTVGCETPTINYQGYNGRPYRYFYAISSDVDSDMPGRLNKVDTRTGQVQTWCECNTYCSEPVFHPSPSSHTEDDGVVLCSLLWGKPWVCSTAILILRAQDLVTVARVTFTLPGPVPKPLHGCFLPSWDFKLDEEEEEEENG